MGLATSERHIKLGIAGVTGLSLVALILTVASVAPSQRGYAPQMSALEPIAVFPDFAAISNVNTKKQQFFDYLEIYVDAANHRISETRAKLIPLADMAMNGVPFSAPEKEWLVNLAGDYKVEHDRLSDKALLAELMLRVDILPPSLVLAQAANESAWGTSRFVLEGNNLFGQWCYVEGCGIIPRRRAREATHEVKRFDSTSSAVEAYFNNINTNQSYRYLRELRASMRNEQQQIDSMVLAFGLGRYSERGEHYVDEVQTLIMQNDLHDRDGGTG